MQLGKIWGVNLRVHYLFLLPLLVWGATGYLLEGLVAFGSVLVHEFGHLARAKQLGYTPKEVQLYPFGGVARVGEYIGLDPVAEMQIALAGPWTNLLLIGVGVLLRPCFPSFKVCDFILQFNIILVAFNLLPALPLDGGRVFRAHLVSALGFKAGTLRAVRVSHICSGLFLLAGLIVVFLHPVGLNLLIISAFLYFSARQILSESNLQLLAYLGHKQKELAKHGLMTGVIFTVAADCSLGDLLAGFTPQKYHLLYVVDKEGKLIGILTEEQLLAAVFEEGIDLQIWRLLK